MSNIRPDPRRPHGGTQARLRALLAVLGILVAVIGFAAPAAGAGTGNGVAAINPGTAQLVEPRAAASPGSVGSDSTLFDDREVVSLVTPSGAQPFLRGTAGNAGRVPASVRTALEGQSFSSRKAFRSAFWRAVADDPGIASQFSRSNQALMRGGRAPIAPSSQHYGGRMRYELHHVTPVSRGGGVYDLDNIVVVTPRYHAEVLSPSYHYGGGG